jgi:hypothetical protein
MNTFLLAEVSVAFSRVRSLLALRAIPGALPAVEILSFPSRGLL